MYSLRIYTIVCVLFIVEAQKCPQGWGWFDGSCYFISAHGQNFDTARQRCRSRQADLVSFNSPEERDFIQDQLTYMRQQYWIGLAKDESDQWGWVDESTPGPDDPDIINWQSGYPNGNGDCGMYHWNPNAWRDVPCTGHNRYVCKRPDTILDLCNYADGWHDWEGKCYKFFDKDATWRDGQTDCESNGGQLAVLNEASKHDIFKEVVNCKDDVGIWIGYSDTETQDGTFNWIDGSNINADNWDDDQPIRVEDGENCVLAQTFSAYKWRVDLCGNENRYVCEKPEGTCADGWRDFGGTNCYQIILNQMVSWTDAKNNCEDQGGMLMKIRNDEEQAILQTIVGEMIESQIPRIRIGISDYYTDELFTWTDRSKIVYDKMDDSRHTTRVDRIDCGYVNCEDGPEALWGTRYCYNRDPHICEIPKHTAPTPIQTPPPEWECPEGWLVFGSDCYYVSSDQAYTWNDQSNRCNILDSRSSPLTIRNPEEQSFISYNMNARTWAYMRYRNSDWTWEDNSSVTFTNWDLNGRNSPNTLGCMMLKNPSDGLIQGIWSGEDCSENRAIACRMPATHVTGTPPTYPITAPWDPACGAGWAYDVYGKYCYQINYAVPRTWEDARTDCLDKGADLVSITSPTEQTFINTLVRGVTGGTTAYWIGLNDLDFGRGWMWTDGSGVPYFNWNDGEPNNYHGNEYCVEISVRYNDRWNDHRCEATYGYICKRPSTQTTTTTIQPPVTSPPAECNQDNNEPLVSGTEYIQDDYITAYDYEFNRFPYYGRLDQQGDGAGAGSCPNFQTDGEYTIEQITQINPRTDTWLVFEVKACQDVKVYLSSGTDYENDNLYEIIFGGWDNTRVGIRKCIHPCNLETYVEGQNWVSCSQFNKFWISWNVDDRIRIGRGFYVGHSQILEYIDPDPVSYSVLAITTAWGNPGEWCLPQVNPRGIGGSWTAATQNVNTQYIRASFRSPRVIIGVITQGASDRDEWVTKFRISYRFRYRSDANYYRWENGTIADFDGNTDRNTKVTQTFTFPFVAELVYFHPREWNTKISMRFEVMGCSYPNEFNCVAEESIAGTDMNIPDSQMIASSFSSFPPHLAKFPSDSGWVASASSRGEYLQIQFDARMELYAILTKGRGDSNMFVRNYEMDYSREDDIWNHYMEPYGSVKTFTGNTDQNSVVRNDLKSNVIARYIRIFPISWEGGIGMRLEVEACRAGCVHQALISGENHYLDGYRLSASSSWNSVHGPLQSRLHHKAGDGQAGSWCSGDSQSDQEYLQADFGYGIVVTAIATQGRNGFTPMQYTTNYTMSYSRNDGRTWHDYTVNGDVYYFEANWDSNSVRRRVLPYGITASSIRLTPKEDERHKCLRWEIYGCPGLSSSVEIGCFSDTRDGRDLPHAHIRDVPGGMTRELCVAHCGENGYQYAGVQYGSECFCGNSYGKYGPSAFCTMQCTGYRDDDQRHICGGVWANSVLSTGLSSEFERCAVGWTEYAGRCFRVFNNERVSWHTALLNCRAEGGDLVSIDNQAENDFVQSQIAVYGEHMWIGFHCQALSYFFEWSNGRPVIYTYWSRREPNNARNNEDCGMMYHTNGQWNDDPCDDQIAMGYVCQKNKERLPEPPPTEPTPGCPQGWVAYRWKCYSLNSREFNWQTHRDNCVNLGGNLARVEDMYEQAFVASQMAPLGGHFWIDLNDRDTPGTYKYTDGNLPSYAAWAQNQPNTGDQPSCVSLSEDDNGYWFDEDCDVEYKAVCEIQNTIESRPPSTVTNPASGDCSSGWIESGNYCYRVNDANPNMMLTWTEAYMDCGVQGAHLASFHSFEEHDRIYRLGIVGKNTNFWIGLSSLGDSGFHWSDDTIPEYFAWEDDNPVEDENMDCVEMITDTGKWANIGCNGKRNWICKIGKGVVPETTTPPSYPTAGGPGSCSPDNDDWVFYNDKCYYLSASAENDDPRPLPQTWWGAEQFCNQKGANLVSIHDDDAQMFIQGQVQSEPAFEMWMGLNEVDGDGWQWTDGTPTDYTNWGPSSPDGNQGSSMCVSMSVQYGILGTWNNHHCQNTFHFICAKWKGNIDPITTPNPPPIEGNCPAGYEPFKNKCYKFVDESVDWSEAYQRCFADNKPYSLASVHTGEDNAFLMAHMINKQRNYWIGLHQFQSGQFGWADNSQVTVTFWAKGEPNGGDQEGCVHMFRDEWRAGQWNDASCSNTNGYICMTYKTTSNPTPPPRANPCTSIEDSYHTWNDDCYKIANARFRSFDEGEAHCQEQGGHIASILSPYEQGFVYAMFADWEYRIEDQTEAWIGLTDISEPGRFRWTDNNLVTYTNWGDNEPSVPDGGCVILRYTDGKWIEKRCADTEQWTLCKVSDKPPIVTLPPGSGSCPAGDKGENWFEFQGSCYLFVSEDSTLSEARLECQLRGGDLASIHNDEENDFIEAHIKDPDFHHWWWIGMTKTINGGLSWLDGSSLGYANWAEGEPSDTDGTADENCVEMYTEFGTWNDVGCNKINGYVCKANSVISTPSTPPIDVPSTTLSAPRSTISATTPSAPTDPGNTPTITRGPTMALPGSGGGLSSGGVVAVVFSVFFALMVASIILVVYLRRSRRLPPMLTADGPSLSNPNYGISET